MRLLPRPTQLALWIAAISTSCAMATAAERGESQWVHTGDGGRLVYKTTPAGDRIMDFSDAGYMGGGVWLPIVPVKQTVTSSGGDDTAHIQAAIKEVATM